MDPRKEATNSYAFYKLKLEHLKGAVDKLKALLHCEMRAPAPDQNWIAYLDETIEKLEDEMDAIDALVDGITGK